MTERSWGTHRGWWLAGTGGCGSRMRKGRKMEVCRRSWVWGLFSGRGLCAGVCWREGEKQGGRYRQWSLLHKRGFDSSRDLLLFASCKRVRYKVMNYSLINRIVLSFKECFEYVCVPGTVFNAEQTVGPRQMWPLSPCSWQWRLGILELDGTLKITSSTLYFTIIETEAQRRWMNLTPVPQLFSGRAQIRTQVSWSRAQTSSTHIIFTAAKIQHLFKMEAIDIWEYVRVY